VAFDSIAAAGYKYAGLMTSATGMLLTAELTSEQAAEMGAAVRQRGLALSSAYGGPFAFETSIAEGELQRHLPGCVWRLLHRRGERRGRVPQEWHQSRRRASDWCRWPDSRPAWCESFSRITASMPW
jgi:hypothetical protein